jgi:hypothetical protein
MNRIKTVFVRIHIGLWILLSMLVTLQLYTDDSSRWVNTTVGFMLMSLYVFYSHFLLLTRYLGSGKKGAYFCRLAAIMLTAPLLYILFNYKKLDTLDALVESYMTTLVGIVPIFILLSWLARVTQNLVINTIKKEQLEKQAVQAELYYLKSQINPHFLFNTLNNIHTLVYKQAATAPEAVLRLASLMRYMIYESNAHTVPLSREITYLEDYISLQQLRYKKASVVKLEITGDPHSCFVAPLLFIHFLENAYKHSPARLEPGDILVKVEIEENTLIFRSQNPRVAKHANALDEPGGIGLTNIRKRLQLLYPGVHTLETTSSDDSYAVQLKINDLHLRPHEGKVNLLYH